MHEAEASATGRGREQRARTEGRGRERRSESSKRRWKRQRDGKRQRAARADGRANRNGQRLRNWCRGNRNAQSLWAASALAEERAEDTGQRKMQRRLVLRAETIFAAGRLRERPVHWAEANTERRQMLRAACAVIGSAWLQGPQGQWPAQRPV
jgi:hypothetical protein